MIRVNLADITRSSYPVNKLPAGITVSGNKVMVNEAIVKDKIFVFAKNAAGKYLKKITSVSFARGDSFGPKIKTDYYYGRPSLIECYTKKGDHLADYKFEVKLTYDEYKKEEKAKAK